MILVYAFRVLGEGRVGNSLAGSVVLASYEDNKRANDSYYHQYDDNCVSIVALKIKYTSHKSRD